ncbi:MAG: DNA mismatch repair protein MutS [Sphingobium sp.]|nr:MAG: DNA mismatch repair protein MutS [Sphingobium sp.]
MRPPLPVVAPAQIPETRLTPQPAKAVPITPARTPAAVLDTGWEKRIRSGNIAPDMSIDLHGHNLAGAHVRHGDSSRRGAIRGEIGHWLETSPYADRIASVRIAHPRHGGDGAIYLILRRKK